MTRFLLTCYRRTQVTEKTQYLDKNVAAIPDLALNALSSQLHQVARRMSDQQLDTLVTDPGAHFFLAEQGALMTELDDYIETVSQTALTEKLAAQLAAGLAIKHYLFNCHQAQEQMVELYRDEQLQSPWVCQQVGQWLQEVSRYTGELYHVDESLAREHWQEKLNTYAEMKNRLMSAGPVRQATLAEIDIALQIASLSKRYVEQLLHTFHRFQVLDDHATPVVGNGAQHNPEGGDLAPAAPAAAASEGVAEGRP